MGCCTVVDSERQFNEEFIHFGIYSQSGVHVNVGFSFKKDHFLDVPFSGYQIKKKVLMTAKAKVSEMKKEQVIDTLLSP
jgi:hypothetical protein